MGADPPDTDDLNAPIDEQIERLEQRYGGDARRNGSIGVPFLPSNHLSIHTTESIRSMPDSVMTSKTLPARRIVQIATIPAIPGQHSYAVFALCEDGTIWENFSDATSKSPNDWVGWEQIPPVLGRL